MASKSKKIGSVIAVVLGCVGAGWLISYEIPVFIASLIALIKNFSLSELLGFILGEQMLCLATIMLAITFFVTIIKDLNTIKKGVSIFSVVIASIVIVGYVLALINHGMSVENIEMWERISVILLAVSYIVFFVYKMGMSKCKDFAWVMAVIGVGAMIFMSCWRFNNNGGFNDFVYNLLISISHIAVFYCGLRKY